MNIENAVKSQRFQGPRYEIPKTKESSAKHLLVFSSSVGRDGGRHKHGVIIAETEEQEPAEIGHAALCV